MSPVHPQRFEVKFFEVIEGGVPSDEDHHALCDQRCGDTIGQDVLQLRVNVPTAARLMVVMLFYAVPLDPLDFSGTNPGMNYASYGVLVGS